MCDRWLAGFENFHADMGDHPPGMSLDRIDNDGPYSPENCRWATPTEQNSNTRANVMITVDGETRTAMAWSRITGTKYTTILWRLRTGKPERIAVGL